MIDLLNVYLLFLPVMASIMIRPILRSTPPFVVGMPVLRATLDLSPEMPKARFKENDKPRIRAIRLFEFFCVGKKSALPLGAHLCEKKRLFFFTGSGNGDVVAGKFGVVRSGYLYGNTE